MIIDDRSASQLRMPSRWAWWVFLLLVALAPGSTKIAGSIWFLMVGTGIWSFFFVPKASRLAEDEAELLSLSRLWLGFCAAAMLFKAVGMTYWGDPWWTRHFDFRLLLAAASLPILLARFKVSDRQKSQLVGALTFASCVALFVAYRHAYHDIDTPSNRINWSGGLVMLTCVMLPMLRSRSLPDWQRWVVGLGVVAYMVSVLLIGARGAYLAMSWLLIAGPFLFVGALWRCGGVSKAVRNTAVALLVVLVAVPAQGARSAD